MTFSRDSLALVTRAQGGDTAALQELLVEHLPSVEAYVRLKAGDLVRAHVSISDLVQSVCIDALRGIESFEYRGEAAFRNWLFKRALNKVIDKARYLRQQKRDVGRETELQAPGSSRSNAASVASCYATICTPSRVAMGKEAMEAFETAFAELKDEYREAIVLYRIVGMGYDEIAAEMNRSEGAVRNLVYRGLARLSTILDEGDTT